MDLWREHYDRPGNTQGAQTDTKNLFFPRLNDPAHISEWPLCRVCNALFRDKALVEFFSSFFFGSYSHPLFIYIFRLFQRQKSEKGLDQGKEGIGRQCDFGFRRIKPVFGTLIYLLLSVEERKALSVVLLRGIGSISRSEYRMMIL